MNGILLVNLGSPATPHEADVRAYLDEFLMDGRVLDLPAPLRRLIVKAFILPRRPARSAEAYQSIWWPEGSPLVVISQRVRRTLADKLSQPVELAMRYGKPSIDEALQRLIGRSDQPVDQILLIPMYPHYAMSTTETVVQAAREACTRISPQLPLQVLPPFFGRPDYIKALAASAQAALAAPYDHLLFSYHGIPERHLRKTDPTGGHCLATEECCETPSPAHRTCYRHQVRRTTAAFVELAEIPAGKYSLAYQSRLGWDRWLGPSTAEQLKSLGRGGTGRLLVICPAFTADCLETLEEIGLRGREIFLAAGGGELELIPCLNDHPRWIETLAGWCQAFG